MLTGATRTHASHRTRSVDGAGGNRSQYERAAGADGGTRRDVLARTVLPGRREMTIQILDCARASIPRRRSDQGAGGWPRTSTFQRRPSPALFQVWSVAWFLAHP